MQHSLTGYETTGPEAGLLMFACLVIFGLTVAVLGGLGFLFQSKKLLDHFLFVTFLGKFYL